MAEEIVQIMSNIQTAEHPYQAVPNAGLWMHHRAGVRVVANLSSIQTQNGIK
jgi:hypothetical protein